MTATASTMDALQDVLLQKQGASFTETWGDAQRVATNQGISAVGETKTNSEGRPVDADFSSLEMESSFLTRTGREPSHEELMEYLEKHKLQQFLTDVIMYVASHFPPDPLDFLLNHINAMVMKHRAQQSGGLGASETKAEHPSVPKRSQTVAVVPAAQRTKVVQCVTTALAHEGMTTTIATKFFDQFAKGEKLTEEEFGKLIAHLEKAWGIQAEDGKVMRDVLKRWRFRANAAKGTRGMPLWPITKPDFLAAWGVALRAVRDRYVPIAGHIHRSLFCRRAAGTLEDSYILGPKLGRGAYGEVRIATLKATQAKRVVKRVERPLQKVAQEDLATEVELLRGMDHPNIIRIFEFFEDETHIDMIMEPCFGGTLTALVTGLWCDDSGEHVGARPEALKESWIAVVVSQMLSALEYAHNVVGVIHKDIKTDNVLLVGRPKLTAAQQLLEPVHAMLSDFGISEVFSPIQPLLSNPDGQDASAPAGTDGNANPAATTGSVDARSLRGRSDRVGGTPSYMSPEMFKGSFTERADIWSLGVVVFMVMTGILPYKGENLLMQAHAVCNPRRHPPWELLTKYKWTLGARWFCQQLLTKDEAARWSATEALRDPWITKTSALHENVLPTEVECASLHGQHLRSHMTNMATACIVSQLSLSQLTHLNMQFGQYDTSSDGRLGHVEMRQVLEDIGFRGSDIDVTIECLDLDNSGVIEYSEFIAGCINVAGEDLSKQLRIVFDIFDMDNSGFISLQELRRALTQGVNDSQLPPKMGSPREKTKQTNVVSYLLPDGKTVDDVMAELDVNHEGKVSFEEFRSYLADEHTEAGKRLYAKSSGLVTYDEDE
eukprot:TRINITY_DN63277_c0_g1_i1.p1 TRINITY_DN63277_c0_g1~~TRINITY_DN63277_c0_g1_i1.p1  ORF type:complete len:847 (-),score=183.59 TRINITY_DN63277_c0_g1_i1:47-2545(-)